jgi:hypothetical protein
MIATLATSQNWPQHRDWSDRPFDANRGFLEWRQLASSKPTGRWNVRLIRRLIKYTHPIRWMCDLMERSTVHGLGLWYSGVWLVDTRCRGMACPGVHAFSRRRTQRVAERERRCCVSIYPKERKNNGYQKDMNLIKFWSIIVPLLSGSRFWQEPSVCGFSFSKRNLIEPVWDEKRWK